MACALAHPGERGAALGQVRELGVELGADLGGHEAESG
jgi:hypothetical protein